MFLCHGNFICPSPFPFKDGEMRVEDWVLGCLIKDWGWRKDYGEMMIEDGLVLKIKKLWLRIDDDELRIDNWK